MRTLLVVVVLALVPLVACSQDHTSEHAAAADHTSLAAAPNHTAHSGAASSPGVPGMVDVEVPVARRQAMGVRTALVEQRALVQRIRTVGIVAADERQVRHIHTKVSGWVQQLSVSFTGQQVRPGEPILSIYSPELVATQREYLLALAAVRRQGDPSMRTLLESARTRLLLWDLSDAQIKDLERSGTPERSVTLHAPIGGYITMKPVYGGMYVTPEMELYTVADLRTVWILADVYEDEIGLVRTGQTATIKLAAVPGTSRTAAVSYINPTVESATRTVRVRLETENGDGALKPGMYATVEIDVPLGDLVAIPEDAVIDTGERRVVFVEVAEGHYQPREVVLGRRAEGNYEVRSGLAPGERVVVSAQFLLDSESRLRAASGGPTHAGH